MMESLCDSVSRICEFFIFGIFLLVHSSSAQEGFVSLACCADSNFIDTNTNISWISDYSWFPNRTSCINITNPTNSNNEEKSRIFEIASGKICYNLTTTKDEEYLVRATFLNSNSQIVGASSFNVYVGGNALSLVNSSEEVEIEGAFLASRNYINFCLEKGQGDPYISYLELRPLQDLEYLQGLSPSVLKLVSRINLGNTSVDIRYPDDRSDRIWKSLLNTDPEIDSISAANISIINYNASVRAPLAVLQTAVTHSNRLVFLHNNLDADAYEYRVFLYFLELNGNVQPGQRVFDIYVNGEKRASNFDILVNGSNYASAVFNSQANGSLNLTLAKISDGKDLGPICNGYEILQLRPSVPTPGQSDDVEVILKVRDELLVSNQRNELLRNWTGDPCLPFHWEGLACETTNGVSAITKLDLSARNFRGPFPLSITKLTRVETLNLSYNGFTGNIPFFPASLNLKLVDLSHNDFTGVLPESLAVLQHLETLNFGCNQLSENLPPNFNSSKISTDYGKCRRLGSSPPINGIVIGTVAFGSLVFTIVVGVVYVCVCRQKLSLQRNFHGKEQLIPKRIIVHLPSPDVGITMSQIKSFSLADIEEATENYRTLIGEGGFGCVFQGRLSDGREVAVKVRSATSTQGTREFDNELSFLSKIQHENLVPLLGSCGENDQQILVYPFMSNGSLQDRLYGELSKRKPLDWPTRLSIALGAARGLTYLHTFSGRCVIHRDVKSSNILLDHSMCAKVADFGFSKYAPQEGDSCASVEVRGTAGYLDPEYYTTHHLSAKSDVFSFGVVLLEIVSGREPLNVHRPRNEWSLVEWAKPYVRDGKIDEIVDPSIKGGYHGEAMWRVVEVAAACVESFSAYRPCMADVVRELEDALIIENNASEYMRSIDSLGGSNRYSIVVDKKIVIPSTPSPTPTPTPTQPSPIAHELAPPEPR